MKISVLNIGYNYTFISGRSVCSSIASKIASFIRSLLIKGWLVFIVTGICGNVEGQRLLWLGYFNGYKTKANDVSADGRYVVGFAYLYSSTGVPFLWDTHTGDKINLGGLGGSDGEARGISADGRFVTGWSETASGVQHAFLWDAQTGQMHDLDTLSNSTSEAWSISADGSVVVGWLYGGGIQNEHAFLWNTQTGEIRNLGTLGGTSSMAYGVSLDGQYVVGWSRTATGRQHAFLYNVTSNEIRDLDLIDSLSKGFAYAVTNGGFTVVGRSDTSFNAAIAVVWSSSSKGYLGTLGETSSEALDVTDDGGTIVGFSLTSDRERRAVMWGSTAINTLDLNVLYDSLLNGSLLVEARAISPDGRFIVGYGYNAQTERDEAFLLDREGITGIEPSAVVPENVKLYQNYPNPFNPATQIAFALPHVMHVELIVYNVGGERVKKLFQGKLEPGQHTISWDGTNTAGQPVASGVYWYQLRTKQFVQTRKMILLR